jgi:cell division protein YceG involved in septum cleavage
MVSKNPIAFRASIVSICFIFAFFIVLSLVSAASNGYAEEKKQSVTIEDGKEQIAEEIDHADEHAQKIKKSVKEDTSSAGKTISGGIKSGFQLLKEGFKSLRRGEGVPADKFQMEEHEP